MLEELWNAVVERETKVWTWERELLANIAELLHAMYRQQMQIWGAKPHQIPPPLVITRPKPDDPRTPEEKAAAKREQRKKDIEVMTPKQFALLIRMGG